MARREPHARLRVSEHVGEIVGYIAAIEARGLAYRASDGSVYFDVRAFGPEHYGHFGRTLTAEAVEAAATEAAATEAAATEAAGAAAGAAAAGNPRSPKRDARDFALWKAAKAGEEAEGRSWDSPWGRGRPGWHIECSALTHSFFGPGLQLHSGRRRRERG